LEPGRVVPLDRLAEIVWGDDPPAGARNAIQAHVSRLRRTLTCDVEVELVARHPGYLLRVDPQRIDLHRFRSLVGSAHRSTDPRRSDQLLRAALTLWRGFPLADVTCGAVRNRLVRGLAEEGLAALEHRLANDLRLGRHTETVAELADLAAEHPLRERLAELWILALYRCCRQADALAAYRQTRIRLAEELGIEPSPALKLLHQRILAADPGLDVALAEAPFRPPVPAQLPAGVAAFTGRAEQLRRLDTLLSGHGTAPAMVIVALTGPAGVGKTALAVHWAHRIEPRFPDGQLFASLRGSAFGPPPRPTETLAGFLYALGVPAGQVPTDLETAIGLYRTLVADKRLLVVLDDVVDPEQVRPLLPGSAGCLVLVTSRDPLCGLVARDGAHRVALDALTPDEARALLARILPSARPDAIAELARLCAHLPLTLRTAAANLLS
ncbi:AfsR/SARP family transcriptional regulator, partial [Actinophytocola sp.]|uniref:AfsR/SARP family transcriptional regulator n=1 Tax=Actinophytocola sp. TaxID=1872138 RepID=UPI002D8048FF